MSDKYKTGTRVRVVIDGEVEGVAHNLSAVMRYDSSGAGFVKVRDQYGTYHYIWVNDGLSGSVELTGPANWPPRIGDVWALPDGTEYFVRRHAHDSDKLVLTSDLLTNAKFFYDEICGEFETFKALGPVLVRRK